MSGNQGLICFSAGFTVLQSLAWPLCMVNGACNDVMHFTSREIMERFINRFLEQFGLVYCMFWMIMTNRSCSPGSSEMHSWFAKWKRSFFFRFTTTSLMLHFWKGEGHQGVFSSVKGHLYEEIANFYLDSRAKGAPRQWQGIEAIASIASVKHQAWKIIIS